MSYFTRPLSSTSIIILKNPTTLLYKKDMLTSWLFSSFSLIGLHSSTTQCVKGRSELCVCVGGITCKDFYFYFRFRGSYSCSTHMLWYGVKIIPYSREHEKCFIFFFYFCRRKVWSQFVLFLCLTLILSTRSFKLKISLNSKKEKIHLEFRQHDKWI